MEVVNLQSVLGELDSNMLIFIFFNEILNFFVKIQNMSQFISSIKINPMEKSTIIAIVVYK